MQDSNPRHRSSEPLIAPEGDISTQFVFIDPAVQDHGALLRGLDAGVAGAVLDPAQNGVQQIAEALAHCTGLSAVSVIAHGTAGGVTLGSGRLDEAALARHAASLKAIGRAMAPGGTLQLFACEAGKGPDGRALVQTLSQATGAAVSAASHVLGGADGGDWSLDVHSAPGGAAPGLPIAAPVLRRYEHALTGATSPPPGFPLDVTDFSAPIASGGSFVTNGDAAVSGTALQLTPDAGNKAGIAVYSQSFSSSLGLSVQFTYDSSGGNGADGISFFLLNGDTVSSASSVTPGGYGGGLGYSDNGQAGITGGFLGVGFDTYGNYAQTDKGQPSSGIGSSSSSTANYIGVRGEGSGTTGYNWITGVPYAPGIDGQRTVQVNVTKLSATQEQLQVYMAPAGSNTFTQVINTTVNQTLPSAFYFGFAASTGGSDDLHQIDNVSVKLPVNLTFGAATVQDQTTGQVNPATLSPGDQFTYTYTLTNSGPNDDGQVTVNDALPANIVGATWQVQDSAGTRTGTGGAIPVDLLSGATATITVTGTVDPNSTSGNADHTVTVSPGDAYSLADPNEATGVTLAIGHGGSSVSLVGANQGVATTDTASITPFSGASVVDTYSEPGTGAAPVDILTVTVAPGAGALSATGATYNASTGVLTASGTAAQLQAVLQSVAFTPAAHTAAPESTSSVALDVVVTDGDNSSGGTSASATQTATVAVTATHDTPTITGAASGQAVNDNATVAPFSAMAVTDPDQTGATVTVTIAGGASNGSFTAASSAGWSESTPPGGNLVYTLALGPQQDVGAAVQSAVRSLVFQPTPLTSERGGSATVGFTVSVADSATPSLGATDANTSVVVTDATPPAAPAGLALAPASDSGAQGDGITKVATPTITGTAEAGSTVALYDGATQLGTASVAVDGSWSITTSTLADGPHQLTAAATDAAGNVSTPSQPLPLTIDTVAPVVAAALLHDTGASAADGVTSDGTLTGTGEAGSMIALSEGGSSLGTAPVDGMGHWTLTPAGLADGAHTVTVSDTNAADDVGTTQTSFTLDTAPPAAPAGLALAPASDSGAVGDRLTNVVTPVITGTAEAGSTVALDDGTTQLGTVVAGADGTWSITASTLADGLHQLTATATDSAGNGSATSSTFALTIDTAAPVVTAAAVENPDDPVTHAQMLAGTGDPNALVTITEGGTAVGTALAGANGTWTFEPSSLSPGAHSLAASETNAAGNTGASAAVSLTVPDPRFDLMNETASTSGAFRGSDYAGPVSYLQAQYSYVGSDNVVLGARVANVFLHSGSGEDALAAKAGSNVLDGGTGSNWLVGADGADGGSDTFFVDGRGGQSTWDTLLNFHPGDILTLWGYNAASGSLSWSDDKGAPGYHGATLQVDFGDGSGASALVTFGGLATGGAHFAAGTGTSGGIPYLMVTRTS